MSLKNLINKKKKERKKWVSGGKRREINWKAVLKGAKDVLTHEILAFLVSSFSILSFLCFRFKQSQTLAKRKFFFPFSSSSSSPGIYFPLESQLGSEKNEKEIFFQKIFIFKRWFVKRLITQIEMEKFPFPSLSTDEMAFVEKQSN